jgi:cytochrome c oxidase cbb3-type subunit 3
MKTKRISILAFLLVTFFNPLWAQVGASAAPVQPDPHAMGLLNNLLFWIMGLSILVLFILIMGLGRLLNSLVEGKISMELPKGTLPVAVLLVSMLISGNAVWAQVALPGNAPTTYGGMDATLFWVMVAALVVEIALLISLLTTIRNVLSAMGAEPVPGFLSRIFSWKSWEKGLTDAVPIERESEVMTDHEYDGIRELDNNLPPWWKYGFYATILFSLVYLFNFHVGRVWDLSDGEYRNQLAEAEEQKQAYLRLHGAKVDESTVKMLKNGDDLASGKSVFEKNCVACHAADAGGNVGPNLTDDYLKHGGSIQSVFKTIKYGVPDNGMIAWQATLKPQEIQQVASYILSLRGTKPANPKAPEGDLELQATDSAAVPGVKADSSKTNTASATPGKTAHP